MNFPLKGSPDGAIPATGYACAHCGGGKACEPHTFYALDVGPSIEYRSDVSDIVTAQFELIYHGAVEDGHDYVTTKIVSVARSTAGCTIYFCSIDCLRGFFDAAVDALENDIARVKGNADC